ncbi:MAG: ASCH domain-containing protein [Nitrososphaerales archaeon]
MKRNCGNLGDEDSWGCFKRWLKENLCEPDIYDKIDWDALVDRSLSFEEAADEVRRLLPSIWIDAEQGEKKIKKIVFIKPLIEKIRRGEIQVTYRNRMLSGIYYIASNRFKEEKPKIFIEIYRSEEVDVNKLTDEEAQLAGIETAEELRSLLAKWYGGDAKIYRNWFKVKQVDD